MIGRGGRDKFRGEYSPRFEQKSHVGRKDAPPSRHLWVGNLSPQLTEHILSEKFLRFGELESVAFQPGRSYAFINFKKEDDAMIAMRGLQGFVLAGLPLKIEFTKGERSSTSSHGEEYKQHRDDRRSAEHGEPFSHKESRTRQSSPETYRFDKSKGDRSAEPSEVLWIGFPSFLNVNEMVLRRAFSPFGEIEKITAFPGRSYAFVRFRSIVSACKAKEALQGKLFDNPRVSICFAKSDLGPSERGRNSTSSPYPPYKSYGPSGLGGQAIDGFGPDRSLGTSTGEFRRQSPRLLPNSENIPGDSSAFGFGRNSSAGMSGTFDRHLSEDLYENHRSPALDRGALGHDFPSERPPRRNPYFGETWELPEEPFPFHEAKKLKTAPLPDKELPEYPFSDSKLEKQQFHPPKLFSDLPEHDTYDRNFGPGPFDYKRIPDHLKTLPRPQAERENSWKTHDNFEAGPGPLPSKPFKWQQPFTPESHRSPLNEEWKWEGTIAKGGTPVCRARCFPVGKVLDVMLPEFLNCTARTGLDMLEKHFYQAASFWVVFFVPQSDADIIFYNEFMHYLGEKQRAAVAKLSEKTTLFLVPPSEFSEKVLKVPGKMSISGVILRFQHPSSNLSSLHHPLEAMDLKIPLRVMDGAAAFHEDMLSFRKSASPGLMPSSWGSQGYMGSSSEPFPSSSSFPPLYKPGVNLPPTEKASDSLSENRYDHLQPHNPTLPSNLSPHQIRNPNSSVGNFPSHSFDDSMVQKYLSGKPSSMQEAAASTQYTPGNSSVLLSVSKPLLSSSLTVPPLQPEQLAQLASLLGQRQQLGKMPGLSLGEDHNLSSIPNQPEQTFKSVSNFGLQDHASAASDSLAPQFPQVQTQLQQQQQQQQQQQASNVSAAPQISRMELQPGNPGNQRSHMELQAGSAGTQVSHMELQPNSSGNHGNQQLQNSSRDEMETDPQKRLQATLQLAASLLQQIQQQAKAAEQR